MAKSPSKAAAAKTPAKKAPAKAATAIDIEKVSESVLAKLKALNMEPQLQSDIEWCLGSYRSDKNPVGLFDMVRRASGFFKSELEKKTKGVTAKLIADLEKALTKN